MDVKEAVRTAKSQVAEIFSDESIVDVGLEEVEFDESNEVWLITIGFTRVWQRPAAPIVRVLGGDSQRAFKIVRIENDTGRVLSVKHRAIAREE